MLVCLFISIVLVVVEVVIVVDVVVDISLGRNKARGEMTVFCCEKNLCNIPTMFAYAFVFIVTIFFSIILCSFFPERDLIEAF